MNINMEYYKIFYHVATEHSITGAAKRSVYHNLPSPKLLSSSSRDWGLSFLPGVQKVSV